jgi:hypothetical protein
VRGSRVRAIARTSAQDCPRFCKLLSRPASIEDAIQRVGRSNSTGTEKSSRPPRDRPRRTRRRNRVAFFSKRVETWKKPSVSKQVSEPRAHSSTIVSVQVQELLTIAAEVIPGGGARNICGVSCRRINRIFRMMSLVRLLGFTNLSCGCVTGHYRELATNREITYVEEKGSACDHHDHRRNHTLAPARFRMTAMTAKAS